MPKLETIELKGFRCLRCNHAWVPYNPKNPPRVCPKCKSPYWDRERKTPLTISGSGVTLTADGGRDSATPDAGKLQPRSSSQADDSTPKWPSQRANRRAGG